MGCVVVGGVVPVPSWVPACDKDWDALKEDELEAAESLGYTQHTWDNDIRTPIDSVSWEQLTDAQRFALTKLGYSANSWDSDSESD
mmetsp:Transcript_29501/g.84463  ORF Transcript_29501/g.84463 Transcript_29501/m.84463 type:complete len:86 (-) Transcript_29501:360-617(-)